MGVTIDQILNMPLMAQAKLLAGGQESLGKTVDAIAIMESVDSIRWLQRNDLVLNNAQLLVLYPKLQATIVDSLIQRGVAGMALKLDRHLRHLPPEMEDAANRRNFPIITVPHHIASSQFINSVTFQIFSQNAYDPRLTYGENFLRELLVSNLSKSSMRNRALTLGWNLRHRMQVAVVEADGKLDENYEQAMSQWGFSHLLRIGKQDVVVAELESSGDVQPDVQQLVAFLQEKNPLRRIHVGVGRPSRELAGIAGSYREAQMAVSMGMTNKPPKPLMQFSQMGVYTILLDERNAGHMDKLFQQTTTLLKQYDQKTNSDCLQTVAVYLEENQSVEQTAKRLQVHYNTVRYRLTKVFELLGERLAQEDVLLNLQIALRIQRCRKLMQENKPV